MRSILDLECWPVDAPQHERGRALVARCRDALQDAGMVSLEGLIRPEALRAATREVEPLFDTASFTHAREHNIYFDDDIEGLEADHPALSRQTTVNHHDLRRPDTGQHGRADLRVAAAHRLPGGGDGEAQALPDGRSLRPHQRDGLPGGRAAQLALRPGRVHGHAAPAGAGCGRGVPVPQRSQEPRPIQTYEGVARLLAGRDERVQTLPLAPGTLNVFKGKNTAHRVTPVEGRRPRIIAVFSYYERPDVIFSDAERLGFYGRADPVPGGRQRRA